MTRELSGANLNAGSSHGAVRRRRGRSARALALVAALGLVACASPDEAADIGAVSDPFEQVNRGIFEFNDTVDRTVLKPVATAYRDNIPKPARDRVSDFLRNLNEPIVFLNQVLQADLEGAGQSAARFFANTLVGFGGFVDIAAREGGVPQESEDFGQTLAVWGAPSGPYLVLPIFGPSNIRDLVGRIADTAADPFQIATNIGGVTSPGVARAGATAVDQRATAIEPLEDLKATSVDFYASLRSLYDQRRNSLIADGEPEQFEIPDFDSDLDPEGPDGLSDRPEPQTPTADAAPEPAGVEAVTAPAVATTLAPPPAPPREEVAVLKELILDLPAPR